MSSNRLFHSWCLPFFLLLSVNFIFVSALKAKSPKTKSSKTSTEVYLDQSLDTYTQGTKKDSSTPLDSSVTSSSDAALGWFMGKVVIVLGVLVAVIYFGARFLKQSGMTGTDDEIMGIRSTLPLGQNQYLQIVQVGPQYYMIGVTENSVSMLGELNDSETIQSLRMNNSGEDGNSTSGSNSFTDIIQRFTGTKDHQFKDQKDESDFEKLKQKIDQIDMGGHTQS